MKRLTAISALFVLAFSGSTRAATILSAEAGGSTHVPMVAFAKAVSDTGVAEIQVANGNILIKSLLAVATGKGDYQLGDRQSLFGDQDGTGFPL